MEFAQFTLACLGGGFKYVLCSPEEDFKFDSYFSIGLKPPTSSYIPIRGFPKMVVPNN